MKKILSVIFVVALVAMLATSAFAAGSYSYSDGHVVGSYEASGNVETYVDGALAGGSKLNVPVSGEGPWTVTVYVNGVLVDTVVVEKPAAPVEPTEAPVEPTEAPVEPTEAPVEPTEAPVEPTEAPVEPTEAPVEPTKAPVEPTTAPATPTKAPAKTDANGKDAVPKTGEFDSTMIVIAALSIAVVGFAGVVVTKKYGKEN